MSMRRFVPIHIREPDPQSRAVADRLHFAVIRGKVSTASKILDSGVSVELSNRSGQTPLFCAAYFGHLELAKLLLKLGADPNRRCSILCCTPVHAACWSGNKNLITTLLIAGGDLRLHDQQNRSPRDWAMLQPNQEAKMATLALIESFRQIAMKGHSDPYLNASFSTEPGMEFNGPHHHRTTPHRGAFKFPMKLRNTLAAMGLVCSENCEYIGPYGNVQGTGFGKTFFGKGESAAALWPVPLVNESEISDPDDEGCGVEADLNGLLPRGVNYRTGPTTEMVARRWHQTPVSLRRIRDNQPPDLLLEELHSMSRLRHPGLMLLMGVCATQHWESVQLIYEPIYHGSLHHRLHIMGSSIPLVKRLRILQQICEALVFLHSKQLLHCSVSSHAVHLVSSSRAKLGCLETLTELDPNNPNSRRVYRKVPPSHWDWMMPWSSPECARGETLTALSDVYSFCCLVWETCSEKLPRSHMDARQIERMWQRQAVIGGLSDKARDGDMMLPLDPPLIPLHIGSFLKLGLQPELSERRDIDLQEIYLMLRLQAAALTRTQQKPETKPEFIPEVHHVNKQSQPSRQQKHHSWPSNEERNCVSPESLPPSPEPSHSVNPVKPPPPVHVRNPHEWEAVKEQLKSRKSHVSMVPPPVPLPPATTPPPPPPLPVAEDAEPKLNLTPILEVSDNNPLNEVVYEEEESGETTQPALPVKMAGPHRPVQCGEIAIKPASHTTERHSNNCLMSGQHQPRPPTQEFEHNEKSVMEVQTGQPSSTSTPRHALSPQSADPNSDTFLACSSRLEDVEQVKVQKPQGVKPKRSLAFKSVASNNRLPSLLPIQPSTDFVSSLKAYFQEKAAHLQASEEPVLSTES